jgi:hypothetical protein
MDMSKLVYYDDENEILMETYNANIMANRPEEYYAYIIKILEGKPHRRSLIDARSIVMGGSANMDKKTRQRLLDASMPVRYEKMAFVIKHPTTRFFAKLMQKMGVKKNAATKNVPVGYFKDMGKATAWLKDEK